MTDIDGKYKFDLLPLGSHALTPSLGEMTFSPASRNIYVTLFSEVYPDQDFRGSITCSPPRILLLVGGLATLPHEVYEQRLDSTKAFFNDLQSAIRKEVCYDDVLVFSYVGMDDDLVPKPYLGEHTRQELSITLGKMSATIGKILQKPKYSSAKIDLIGHSLGGVVSLGYVQEYWHRPSDVSRIGHVITLDSPVNGSERFNRLHSLAKFLERPRGRDSDGSESFQLFMTGLHVPDASGIVQRISGIPALLLAGMAENRESTTKMNFLFASALARKYGILVWTMTNCDEKAILPTDALIPGWN